MNFRQIRRDAYRVASAQSCAASRMDANETSAFARELEEIDATLYEKKYPAYKGLDLVPVKRVSEGADLYTEQVIEQFGSAEELVNYSDDPPMSDVNATESSGKLFSFWSGFQYTVQDARRSKLMRVPVEAKRAEAARKVLAKKLNDVIFSGISTRGVTGLLNNASVSLVTSGLTGTWSGATASQIVADIQTLEMTVFNDSKGVEQPDTLLLPLSLYRLLSKPIGDNVDKTVLGFLMQPGTLAFVKNIEWAYDLETADAGGTGPRAVIYRRDSEAVEALVAIEFVTHPTMQKNLSWVTPCETRTGGVVFHYPGSARYCDVLG